MDLQREHWVWLVVGVVREEAKTSATEPKTWSSRRALRRRAWVCARAGDLYCWQYTWSAVYEKVSFRSLQGGPPSVTYLSHIICLAHLMNHSPQRVLSARYDRNHIPRIPVPIHNRRLVSLARSHRLDFETEPVAGGPGARDVELLGTVAATDNSTTSFGTEIAGLEGYRRSATEER